MEISELSSNNYIYVSKTGDFSFCETVEMFSTVSFIAHIYIYIYTNTIKYLLPFIVVKILCIPNMT